MQNEKNGSKIFIYLIRCGKDTVQREVKKSIAYLAAYRWRQIGYRDNIKYLKSARVDIVEVE